MHQLMVKLCVAQIAEGMHWLPVTDFLHEVRRLLKPNGVFAVMGYSVCKFDNQDAQKVCCMS